MEERNQLFLRLRLLMWCRGVKFRVRLFRSIGTKRRVLKYRMKNCLRHYLTGQAFGKKDILGDVGITKIKVLVPIFNKKVVMRIWVMRPGVLIGVKAQTIDSLKEYLQIILSDTNEFGDRKLEIKIHDSNIWK